MAAGGGALGGWVAANVVVARRLGACRRRNWGWLPQPPPDGLRLERRELRLFGLAQALAEQRRQIHVRPLIGSAAHGLYRLAARVAKPDQRRFRLLLRDVVFAEVLLRLQQIVRLAEERDVLDRRRTATSVRHDVLILDLHLRSAATAFFSDVRAASAFAVEDLTSHRCGNVPAARR